MNILEKLTKEDFEYILDGKSLFELLEDSYYTSQFETLMYLLRGDNVFISGPAGSGKSYVLEKYFNIVNKYTSRTKEKIKVQKTSTTGLSALNIGGKTIHSYSGMGGDGLKYEQQKNIIYKGVDRNNLAEMKSAKLSWGPSHWLIHNTNILIIDEVSMLSERGLEFVVERLKEVKEHLWGDTQIIVSGDFSQLPPVSTSTDINDLDAKNYCYNTKAWKELNFTIVYLDRLYRAKDKLLSQLLNSISLGYPESAESILNNLPKTREQYIPGSALLLSRNVDVDNINKERQDLNPNPLITYHTLFSEGKKFKRFEELKTNKYEKIIKDNKIPLTVSVKEGDTIMVTSNINEILKNGVIGTFALDSGNKPGIKINNEIHSLDEYSSQIKETKWVNGEQKSINKGGIKIVPIKLAYAITIHKSQGQTFSKITTNLNGCWTEGLGYVALSRSTSIDGITLIENGLGQTYNDKAVLVDPRSIIIKSELLETALENRKKYLGLFLSYFKFSGEDIDKLLKEVLSREPNIELPDVPNIEIKEESEGMYSDTVVNFEYLDLEEFKLFKAQVGKYLQSLENKIIMDYNKKYEDLKGVIDLQDKKIRQLQSEIKSLTPKKKTKGTKK